MKPARATNVSQVGSAGDSASRAKRSSVRVTRASVSAKRASSGAKHASVSAKQSALVVAQLEEIERDGGAGTVSWTGGSLDVSSLNKTFFPATKHTKGDVMRYYASIAPLLLPAIADRPLVMKRFPNGATGKAFYQQRAPTDAPASVRVESVSDEGMTTQDKIVGGDLATLLYVVQLGAISIDPWHSRIGWIQDADYAIIDLDPGPRADFRRVVDVALAVKSALDKLKLHGVPKTSGASGMHIVLPLGDGVPTDGARMIAEVIATMVVALRPRVATIERSVRARKPGAVYVDFLQNIRGKTVAGVYSVRAERRPTVSTPLRWDEVNEDLDPAAFTIDTLLPRVGRVGDLWAKGMRVPNSLDGIIGNG